MDKELKKNLLYSTVWTMFLALFGAIYELFSHDVYSYYMIYAFAVPLTMGVLPYVLMLIFDKHPNRFFYNFWNTAIATLSIGCLFSGVLSIYGTTNSLIIVYPIAGIILMIMSIVALIKTPHVANAT